MRRRSPSPLVTRRSAIAHPHAAGNPRSPQPRRSRPLHQAALADLRRRSALGAAAADRSQGVSQSPQASLLPARRGHAVHRHRGDETVGRILVSDDPHYNQQHGENVGCFGMFECVDDRATAHALLDAAAGWLRARGRTAIRGPIDYSINYPCGLLVEGFDTPPRIMMNHNRRYYAGLLESWGLRKAKDLYAWWFTDPRDLTTKWKHAVGAAGPAQRRHRPPLPHRTILTPRWPAARKSTTPR